MSIDLWALGPKAAAYRLCLSGFTPPEAERLVALKLRLERGLLAREELTDEELRRRFVRWLVDQGRLTEWPTPEEPDSSAPGR